MHIYTLSFNKSRIINDCELPCFYDFLSPIRPVWVIDAVWENCERIINCISTLDFKSFFVKFFLAKIVYKCLHLAIQMDIITIEESIDIFFFIWKIRSSREMG